MSRDALAKVEELLAALAEQMGVATDYFWPLFVRQQIIEGIAWAVSILIATAVGLALLLQFRKVNIKRLNDEDEMRAYVAATGAVLLLFTFLATVIAMPTLTSKVFNPEYAALKDVIEMVKP